MTGKKGFARLLEIAGEKRGLLIAAGLFSAVSAVCMLMPYVSVYFILRELLEHAASPALADGAKMIRWGVIAIAGFAAGLAATYAGGLIAHIAAFRILYGLRIRLAGHIGKLPLGWLSSRSTGAVKKTLEDNVDRVELFIAHQLPDLVHAAVTLMVMIAVMFSFNVWLAIACILPMVIGVAAQFLSFASPKTRNTLKSALDALERMNASAVQYVRGMPAVKVFGQTVHSFRQFYQDMVRYRDHGVMLTQLFQNGNLTFKVILNSLAAFILPVGVFLLNRDPGSITAASAVLFFLVMAPGIAAPMFKLMYLMENTRLINEGVERFDRILAEPPLPEPEIPRRPASFDVTFDHVFFSYGTEPTDTDALADISFTARQGEVTALVGPSGAGKSTVAHLVPRFWNVNMGAVRIGGVDIRDMTTADLMDTVAFVFQDSFLFSDTVYNNIAVGRPDAAPEEVYAAAQAAQCHAFIEKLPQGYGTRIGEGGVHLSGGEAQRINVARAILKNAPILVLDEATAFADPENEHEMQLALKALMKDKTVLVIAHRLSTIRDADQILVMEDGRIVERGKHEALLASGGLYTRMWQSYRQAAQWHLGKGEVDADAPHASQHYGG
ncbi:Iron import ATP-binding/permease protein IrtA [Thermobacillus xylanilyticus]|uniref:Iron import ATP-binding/permease protein IrtA n=1 Tax=Thermobacillus xylanilyticus TaxID=76633 RepID=A0ABM8V876_THEXY|nr:ABC transporter ATP-binding protein [Thermobacillus xylanilyticus]REJ12590.1 MAG: ABC transporter ATP-binding protein [Paenibacillaceae bacterium]CAG5091634.1 Iron import ATP-binding/permease protein IrtA [Thermobacillus xylanilyticus]